MVTSATTLTQHGVKRSTEVVQLAAQAGLELAAAATMLEKESAGGANVWGHDHVSSGGFYVPGSPVTKTAYLAYKAHRHQLGAQGVGPTQLTWPGYQDRADAMGGCWDWRVNCAVGFGALGDLIRAHGYRGGFKAYNGADAYAEAAMARLAVWRQRLGPVPVSVGQHPTLRFGDVGAVVARVQAFLNRTFPLYSQIDLGPQRYGPQTAGVVAEFQNRAGVLGAGVDPTGRTIGPATWAALETFGYQ